MTENFCLLENSKDIKEQGFVTSHIGCSSGATVNVKDPIWLLTNSSEIPVPSAYYTPVDESYNVYSPWDSMLFNPYYVYESKEFELFEQYEILKTFSKNIIENTQDIDPEIAKVVNDNFWELL